MPERPLAFQLHQLPVGTVALFLVRPAACLCLQPVTVCSLTKSHGKLGLGGCPLPASLPFFIFIFFNMLRTFPHHYIFFLAPDLTAAPGSSHNSTLNQSPVAGQTDHFPFLSCALI